MALDLNEYIKMSYERPNRKVLEGLGASEDLIEYLMETPGNTNWNVLSSLSSSSGDEPEVWLVGDEYNDAEWGREFILSNVGDDDHMAELLAHGNNYQIFLNGTELPYYTTEEGLVEWLDSDSEATETSVVYVSADGDTLVAVAAYVDISTAPTSVEVSVKAK